jgi:flavin reductase (DIM6/NTAB) family NADH-FMN oxidoreductase RutF
MLERNKSIMFYEPRLGHGLPHDPFKAIVAPRPIGWISTADEQGRHNLAPYSYFNAISSKPPMVAFSSEGMKDSVRTQWPPANSSATWQRRRSPRG